MEDTSMEDDRNGRQHQWKTTSIEDDLNGRRPKWKRTSMEDNLYGRQLLKKVLNGRQPYKKMTQEECLTGS